MCLIVPCIAEVCACMHAIVVVNKRKNDKAKLVKVVSIIILMIIIAWLSAENQSLLKII